MLNLVLKAIIHRARPAGALETGFAFPSGHAMAASIAYGALILLLWPRYKKTSYALVLLPLIVSYSRVAQGVHWASDVVGGIFFGVVWLAICFWVVYGRFDKKSKI